MIDSFSGDYAFLSNFYIDINHKIIDDFGIKYPTVEHYYQAQKTLDKSIRNKFANDIKTPGESKKFGTGIDLRSDWEDIKLNVMFKGLKQKFYDNSVLSKKLIDTGDEFLVEGNYWNDTFWGVCNGKGRNMLGYLLMIIRDNLKLNFKYKQYILK